LSLGSLKCPKGLLVHQQVALTIFIGGIGLISLNIIALATYLMSWALVTSIIASRFLLDFHPFLLKAIGANSLGSLPFQAHLRLTQRLLRLGVVTCVPPFEQLAEQGANCFQKNISKRLHDHFFNIIFFCLLFDTHQTCLKLCAGQDAKALLLTCLIIFFFPLLSNVFSTTLHTRLSFSHPLVFGVSHYICN
jgi:hypothetical protein